MTYVFNLKMKTIIEIIIIFLLLGNSACVNQKVQGNIQNNSLKFIMLELNTEINYEFGLPVKSEYFSKLFFNLADGDSSKKEFDGQLLFVKLKRDSLFFEYTKHEDKIFIKGKYWVPDYRDVEYKKSYDLGASIASEITPLHVYIPIRSGIWIYKDGENKIEVSYNVQVKSGTPPQE